MHGVLEKDEQNLCADDFGNEDALTTGTQNVKERIKLMTRCHRTVEESGRKSEFLLSPKKLPKIAHMMTRNRYSMNFT